MVYACGSLIQIDPCWYDGCKSAFFFIPKHNLHSYYFDTIPTLLHMSFLSIPIVKDLILFNYFPRLYLSIIYNYQFLCKSYDPEPWFNYWVAQSKVRVYSKWPTSRSRYIPLLNLELWLLYVETILYQLWSFVTIWSVAYNGILKSVDGAHTLSNMM